MYCIFCRYYILNFRQGIKFCKDIYSLVFNFALMSTCYLPARLAEMFILRMKIMKIAFVV